MSIRRTVVLLSVGAFLVGGASALVYFNRPLKTCIELLAPMKAKNEAGNCFITGKSAGTHHSFTQLVCPKTMTELVVLVTDPNSDVDNIAQKDTRLTVLGQCQLNANDRANIYFNEDEIHAEPGQSAQK